MFYLNVTLMRKFTLMLLSALFAVFSYAQGPAIGKSKLVLEPFAPVSKTSHVQGITRDGVVRKNTAPVQPSEFVTPPAGVETSEYAMTYKASSTAEETTTKPVNVAVDGNDVYFQGMSRYIPEAWVKGTKSGNTVTFPAMQYMGEYGSYGSSFFFYEGDVVFTYNAETDTYSAEGQVYGVLADQYYDGNYFDPVLNKVAEVAATPATPTITGIEKTSDGDVVTFQIPIVDVDGNGMVTSKLSYQFFVDDESTPLEFTTEYFTKLTENVTVIPYGFTDNWDFSKTNTYIYLNMPHSTWQQLGIQSIYTGGGVTNKSEIFWFTMPTPPVEAPADLTTEAYVFRANAIESGKEDDGAQPYTIQVKVGFADNDVFIQGLATDMPELWVKGTKNAAGKYVIPANQYMGDLSFFGYTFPYYWTAVSSGDLVDTVLDFNTETNSFSTSQTVALNGAADALDYYLLFNNVTITRFIEVAATPVNPVYEEHDFTQDQGYNTIYANIPTVDGDGNLLNVDKLYYTIWYEKEGVQQAYVFTAALYPEDFDEDTQEIPYTHDGLDVWQGGEIIYLEDDPAELATWTKVGIQSIYYGAGERHVSEIVWSDGSTTTGVKAVKVADSENAPLYNLAGQRVNKNFKGIVVKNGKKFVNK